MGNKRRFKITVFLVVGTVLGMAFFLAKGTVALVAARVLPLTEDKAPQTTPTPRTLAMGGQFAGAPKKDGLAVLRRNLFDSVTGPLDKEPVPVGAEISMAPVVQDPNAPPPLCESGPRLIGTMVHPSRGDRSFAVIAPSSGPAAVLQEGMQVDGKSIAYIETESVHLRAPNGGLCQIALFSRPFGAGETAAPPIEPLNESLGMLDTLPGAEPAGSIPAEELDRGIQQVSETEFHVSRSLLNKILENQAELMRSARIVPQREGGRVSGIKLYGIRRTSILKRVGLQNGDALRTINGYDMTDPKNALEAYAKLRSADRLTVAVVRHGTPMNIEYSIR